jgi:hypothetical protein
VSKPLPDGLVQSAAESDYEEDEFAAGPQVFDLAAFTEEPDA